MKSKRNFLLLAGVGLLVVAGAIIRLTLFDAAELMILNANPYPCAVAVKYEVAPGDWQTVGWMRFEPGERKVVAATFYRVEPQFYVTAESLEPELLKWLTDTGDGVVYFVGDEAIGGELPKNRALDLGQDDSAPAELEEVKFSRVRAEDEIYILTDPLFHDAVLANGGEEVASEEEGFELIRGKAAGLFESLRRQKRFEDTFKSEKDFPFVFEFNMTDQELGFMYLGVVLSGVRSHTLHGDEIHLRDGDILIGIKSGEEQVTPIYTPADAYLALHEHGVDTENGGITEPLHFLVIRDNELLEIESYFLFNPAFNWGDETEGQAFTGSLLNSLTLGFWAQISSIFSDDPDAAWKKSQQLYRLKQRFPKAAQAGEIVGLLIPTPTRILNLGKGIKAGGLLSSPVARGIGIEILRLAVYDYKTSVPAPQTKRLTTADLSRMFPSVPGINLVSGIYKGPKGPSFKVRKQRFGRTR